MKAEFIPKRRSDERILQEMFAKWLDTKGILYNASMAGVNLGIRTAVIRKRMGAKKGFVDLFIYEPKGAYHGLAIELKAKSKSSPKQRAWQEALEARGYKAYIMSHSLNFTEALDWLKDATEKYMRGENA